MNLNLTMAYFTGLFGSWKGVLKNILALFILEIIFNQVQPLQACCVMSMHDINLHYINNLIINTTSVRKIKRPT